MIQMAAKYLYLLKIEIHKFSEFKVNFFSQCLILPVKFLVLILFLGSLYEANGEVINGYTYWQMIFYYVQVSIISFVVQPFAVVTYELFRDIQTGNIDVMMTKPVSYLLRSYLVKCHHPLFGFFFLAVADALYFGFFEPVPLSQFLVMLGIQLLFLIISASILFLLFALVGILSFFISKSLSIRDILWMLIKLFSGSLLPVAFYSDTFLKISNDLPFQYIYYIPTLAMSEATEALVYVLPGLLWIIVLGVITKLLYHWGCQIHESLGG